MQYFLHGDLETGGLNGRIENGKLGMEYYPIFELAFIVTDLNLEQVGEPLRLVIHHSEDDIAKSHEWAIKKHTESGLLDDVRFSALTLEQAEIRVIDHLKSLGIEAYDRKEKTGAAFSGNSIMFDRSYIMCQMPNLHDYLHYRQLDISALALAASAFKPELEKDITSKKQYKHEALADIRESIAELKMYRTALFQLND
jgi:oligoribonuclease (3'-5' exoribonuclease)